MTDGNDQLLSENEDLRIRLEEAEETLRAIRSGAVDALFIGQGGNRRVYTLEGADRAYRIWVEQMHQGAATLLADGTIAYANRRLASLLAIPSERLLGLSLRDFVLPDDQNRYEELCRENSMGTNDGEFFLQRLDGSRVCVLLTYNLLPVDSGAVGGILVTDLTNQKHHERVADAHAALKASEGRYRTLFTSMDEGFCVIEMLFDHANRPVDYRFLETNPAFEKQCGLKDAVGKRMREFAPDHDAYWFEIYGKVAITGEPVRFVNEAKVLDGRWFEVYACRPGDPDSRRVAIFFSDITERKHAEDTTRFLANASAALVELVDYESGLQRVANLAVIRFADWCVVDILDDHGNRRRISTTRPDSSSASDHLENARPWSPIASDLSGIPHVLRTGEPELMPDVADTKEVDAARDFEYLASLRTRGVRSYLCVPLLSRGKVIGGLTFLTIGQGRRYSLVDLQAAEDLARRVTIALENAKLYQTLQDADRRKDEFLATLAHELRNPLAPLRTGLHILNMAPSGPAAATAREMMERQLAHLVRLIDDLLDVSRISQGKLELRRERVELRTVIQNAIEISRPVIEAGRHHMALNIVDQPVCLYADLTRIAQVLGNVLAKAAKYTPNRGHIELVARRESGTAVVSVSDTGVGIPNAMLGKVFDLFTQVNKTLDRSQGGLGIGLSLVKRLVEMHSGTVEVESGGEGLGTTFTIRVPIASDIEEAMVPQPSQEGRASKIGRRILVVDDNRDGAESLAMMLKLSGHDARTAHDGPQGLAIAQTFFPEMVFLDIGLPGMNGYEVAKRFRANTNTENIVLIALTGWGGEEDKRRSKEAGFDFHLTKPVEAGAVESALATYLPF